MPLQESEEPEIESGNEVVYVVPVDEVATQPSVPFAQPRTCPAVPVPYRVEVACIESRPVADVPRMPALCEPKNVPIVEVEMPTISPL